uniref:T9SS type A sorting domain-containing protein n=1 Tax=Zunongwangia profunda TaxID=398743 RepID=UPI0030DDC5B2
GISYFQLGDILNERIPCNNGYGDFVSSSTNLDRSQQTFTVTVETYFQAEADEEKFSMWIDLDDNGEFDDDERLITSKALTQPNTSFAFDFNLPDNAPLGQHLLRIRAGDTRYEGDLNSPCDVMTYGTTHDYSVNIVDSNLDIKDFILNDAELMVLDEYKGHYRVVLETSFAEPLRITVHNVRGQKMLENKVENTGDGYVYDLDMSYAARGVYLVRIGTRKVGKVKRFIVK